MFSACHFTPLPELAVLRASGPDASAFLHAQLTCDVRGLSPQAHVLGAHCNAKGRVLHLFRLCRQGDDWLLLVPLALADEAQATLRRFMLRRKLALAAEPALAVAGLGAADSAAALPPPDSAREDEAGLLLGLPGERPRALLLTTPDRIAKQTADMTPAQWQLQDIAAGLPQVLPGASGLFVPQMLNLHALGAVAFNKGCYPGQEIVARMHYLGNLKRRMYRARIASRKAPMPGAELLAADGPGNRAGTIVMASCDGAAVQALAVVQVADAGRPMQLKEGDAAVTLNDVPYPVPEGHAAPATAA